MIASLLSALAIAAAGTGCGNGSATTATNATPQPSSPAATVTRDEDATTAAAGDGNQPVALKRIGSFDSPVHIAFSKRYRDRTYVVEQGGIIRVIDGGTLKSKPFLDIRNRVSSGGERGLLSMAFHPSSKHDRTFYVYFTNGTGDIEVDEYRQKNGNRARPGSRRKVITVAHRDASNHNGGQLQFGPDRMLYLGTGDGGGGGDPDGNSQNRRSLLGKMLRINPLKKSKRAYTVPSDNPYKGKTAGRNEIYAIGLRNPYRFSFDRQTGEIAIGDVGQGAHEEINFVRPKRLRKANFGWNRFEGRAVYDDSTPTPRDRDHTRPIFTYSHSGGNCSITGGYVVRDKRLPGLIGRYLYADFCQNDIRSLVPSRPDAGDDRPLGISVTNPSSFGESPDGRIYISSLAGEVFRLDPAD